VRLPILDLVVLSRITSLAIALAAAAGVAAALALHPVFWVPSSLLLTLTAVDLHFRLIQRRHTVLRNFGIFGWLRYLLESVGPELRQYWIASDIEERPFNRRQRAEVYRLAKAEDVQTAAFGSVQDDVGERILHSFYPLTPEELAPYAVTFGDGRDCPRPYTIHKPFLISAMSFGALGEAAVRALARGARRAGIPINSGEGGYPRHHLDEGADVIFQIGTGKFGVRTADGSLDDDQLRRIADDERVKMIELKLSQGAKPGRGGYLPGDKVTAEVAQLRGVRAGHAVHSPPRHPECASPLTTVRFLHHLQQVSRLPVGIKFCLGDDDELRELVDVMCASGVFPDYMVVDGSEGGTGAAPQGFMDHVGLPLFTALDLVVNALDSAGARARTKIIAAGRLIDPASQLKAFAHGADAVYTARGFLLALGCIQALSCNTGKCPVGIATHDPALQRGLDIEAKAARIFNYVDGLEKAFFELLAATGRRSPQDLSLAALAPHADSAAIAAPGAALAPAASGF